MFQEITISEFPQVLQIDTFVIKIIKMNAKVAKKVLGGGKQKWKYVLKIKSYKNVLCEKLYILIFLIRSLFFTFFFFFSCITVITVVASHLLNNAYRLSQVDTGLHIQTLWVLCLTAFQ